MGPQPHRAGRVAVAVAAHVANDLRRVAWLEERRIDVEPVVTWDASVTHPYWNGEVVLLPVGRLRNHVAFVAEIRPEAGVYLADWLLQVAHVRLELFDGFAADMSRSDDQHLYFVPWRLCVRSKNARRAPKCPIVGREQFLQQLLSVRLRGVRGEVVRRRPPRHPRVAHDPQEDAMAEANVPSLDWLRRRLEEADPDLRRVMVAWWRR